MWEKIIEQWTKECGVLRSAPILFILTLILAGAGAFILINWRNQGIFDVMNAEMAQKDETIKQKSDLIDEYRGGLQVTSPAEAEKKLNDLMTNLNNAQNKLATLSSMDDEISRLSDAVNKLEASDTERKSQEWPPLSDNQAVEWSKKLATFPTTTIYFSYADERSVGLLESFYKLFDGLHWKIAKPLTPSPDKESGIIIMSKVNDNLISTFIDLFKSIGYEAHWSEMKNAQTIWIYIGTR